MRTVPARAGDRPEAAETTKINPTRSFMWNWITIYFRCFPVPIGPGTRRKGQGNRAGPSVPGLPQAPRPGPGTAPYRVPGLHGLGTSCNHPEKKFEHQNAKTIQENRNGLAAFKADNCLLLGREQVVELFVSDKS